MTSEQATTKAGVRLVEALKAECEAAGLPLSHLAAKLGIVKTYWQAICSGHKSIQPLVEKPEACRVFADFLRVPKITVMSLAEVVLAEDFVVEQSLDDQLNSVYLSMARDPLWSSLVPRPATWDTADQSMKMLIVSLYQAALQASMLQKAGKVAGSHLLAPREGLAPALDQLAKWGQAPRPERASASM